MSAERGVKTTILTNDKVVYSGHHLYTNIYYWLCFGLYNWKTNDTISLSKYEISKLQKFTGINLVFG